MRYQIPSAIQTNLLKEGILHASSKKNNVNDAKERELLRVMNAVCALLRSW